MFEHMIETVKTGDSSGNGMLLRFRFPSGLEIVGLPTRNFYGGDWDLGPTWNYLVLTEKPFLFDTGRHGTTRDLLGMMESCGFNPRDLQAVTLSHGHEDHDGGLADVAAAAGATVRVHPVYDRLIRFYPDQAPDGVNPSFPASCWHCSMPESFADEYCRDYHHKRSRLTPGHMDEGSECFGPGVTLFHLPGHSPDSIAFLIDDTVLLAGDVILPHISPFPSTESLYQQVSGVIGKKHPQAENLYGLKAYIRSLKRLRAICEARPGLTVLPGHRLYYGGQWNPLKPSERVAELLQHHHDRCAAILGILKNGPLTAMAIALKHFEDRVLKGPGKKMAEREIVSHCEILEAAGDVVRLADGRYEPAGKDGFAALIDRIQAD